MWRTGHAQGPGQHGEPNRDCCCCCCCISARPRGEAKRLWSVLAAAARAATTSILQFRTFRCCCSVARVHQGRASLQQVARRVWFFPTEGAPGCRAAGLPTALAVAGLETPYPVHVAVGRQPVSHSQMVDVQGAHGVQARDRWRWAPPPTPYPHQGGKPAGRPALDSLARAALAAALETVRTSTATSVFLQL